MIPTISFVQTKFDEFNSLCFDGKLPPLTIKMSRARTFLGQLSYKRRIKLFGKVEKYAFVLKISTSFDLPEQEVEDIILHEMIHYHIGVNQLTDTSAHGQLFRKIMNDINTRFSRHVTISNNAPRHSTPPPDSMWWQWPNSPTEEPESKSCPSSARASSGSAAGCFSYRASPP